MKTVRTHSERAVPKTLAIWPIVGGDTQTRKITFLRCRRVPLNRS